MLTLNSYSLTEWQRCKRRWLLERDWLPLRWRPKSLFESCMRHALVALSNGEYVEQVIGEAQARYMQLAADPGLDVSGVSPYTIAKDYCAMMATILLSYSRMTLLSLRKRKTTHLNADVEWDYLSYEDESGTLHRFLFPDAWDNARIASEIHSWFTFADVAIARVPMELHAIVVGQLRNGRCASMWSRGWIHPGLLHANKIHFRSKHGKALEGWKPAYLADNPNEDVNGWVEQMWQEGAAQSLLQTITVNPPPDAVSNDTANQILVEAEHMQELLTHGIPYQELPMSRSACDGPLVPCVFQDVCHSEQLVEIEKLGLYSPRVDDKLLLQGVT